MESIGFNKTVFGYNPKQVDEAVDKLMSDIEQKDAQIAKYGEKFKELNDKLEALDKQQIAERAIIADMMISARQDAMKMLDLARGEADMIASDAKHNAESVIANAELESIRMTSVAENEVDAIRRRIHEEYAQTEMDMRDIAESARHAKDQMIMMFEASEGRIAQLMDNVRQLLPEAGSGAKRITEGAPYEDDYIVVDLDGGEGKDEQ